MYRLVIADDDQMILEGLREEINWEELGFEIVKTFNDGEALIEYLNCVRVDAVLTDVKMHHISGIDVARYVYNSELPCKVVFISGYKEFDLVVQALRYGVKDYILKPTSENEVKEVMNKIRNELDKMTADIEFRQRAETYWVELRPVLAKKFVNGILMGSLDNEEEIKQRMHLLYQEKELMYCPCVLASMEIVHYTKFINIDWKYGTEQFHDAIDNFVRIYEEKAYFHVAYKNMGHIQLFVMAKEKCATPEGNNCLCENLIAGFAEEFHSVFGAEVKVSIERIFKDICEVVELQSEIIDINGKFENKGFYFQERQKEILTNIMEGNVGGAQKIMKNSLHYFHSADIQKCKEFTQEVFVKIMEFLGKENAMQRERMEYFLDDSNIYLMQSVSEIEKYCDQIFDRMKSKEGMQEQFDEHNVVNQIKDYIAQHIFEDICLDDVADFIFISTRHLTRIFKKQTGETFLQYLTDQKMVKAAELLMQPQCKVWQVGESLGYKTPRYFTKLFYSYYGCCPSEYRQKKLEEGVLK